jgi:Ca2+-binding EF-hand superfamily protein
MEDLTEVLGCLMVNDVKTQTETDALQHPATQSNIEDLFRTIDVKHTGKIDFEGFKKFYDTILIAGTTTIKQI